MPLILLPLSCITRHVNNTNIDQQTLVCAHLTGQPFPVLNSSDIHQFTLLTPQTTDLGAVMIQAVAYPSLEMRGVQAAKELATAQYCGVLSKKKPQILYYSYISTLVPVLLSILFIPLSFPLTFHHS